MPLGLIFADHERDALFAALERDATSVAAVVEDDLEAGARPRIDTLLTGYAAGGGRDRRRGPGRDQPGRLRGRRRVGEDFTNRPEIAAALAGERATGTRRSETVGGDLVYVAVPVTSGGTIHGAVRVTYPIAELDHRIRENWMRLGLLVGRRPPGGGAGRGGTGPAGDPTGPPAGGRRPGAGRRAARHAGADDRRPAGARGPSP